ncbi:hypothetical protein [Nocardioides montaniterrae]
MRNGVGSGVGILVVVWLLIGVLAAWQRGYFGGNGDVNCRKFSDTALTIVAGPLNYVGVNPKVDCAKVKAPQPSK